MSPYGVSIRGSRRPLRGFVLTTCLGLAVASAALSARAGETPKAADPEFRLLVLGGHTVRWNVPAAGLPATITYAFLTEPASFPGARNCDAMLAPDAALKRSHVSLEDFRREVRAAFSQWEQAANIVFKEVSSAHDAGILIGADAKSRGRAFTNVALHQGLARAEVKSGPDNIRQSLICLNPDQPWKIGFDGNLNVYDLRFTVTHEIGHAIGLDHPSPEGQLMSFRYVEKSRTLQPGDVAGAVALYGRKGMDAPAMPAKAPSPSPAPSGDRAFGLGANESR